MSEKEIHSAEENVEAFSGSIQEAAKKSTEDFLKWFDGGENERSIRNSGYRDFFSSILKESVFQKTSPISDHLRGLEIGCGGGRITNAACSYFQEMIGLDIHESLDETEKFLAKEHKNFVLKRIENNIFPVESATVDCVYSLIVFQHILKFDCFVSYVSEIKRVLKISGVSIIYFGRPKFLSKHIFKNLVLNMLLKLVDKVFFEWIYINTFCKGYKEYPKAPVNHVSLVVSLSRAKQLFQSHGFAVRETGISRKKSGFGTQYYIVVEAR